MHLESGFRIIYKNPDKAQRDAAKKASEEAYKAMLEDNWLKIRTVCRKMIIFAA